MGTLANKQQNVKGAFAVLLHETTVVLQKTTSHSNSYCKHFAFNQAEPFTALAGRQSCLIGNAVSNLPCAETDTVKNEWLTTVCNSLEQA